MRIDRSEDGKKIFSQTPRGVFDSLNTSRKIPKFVKRGEVDEFPSPNKNSLLRHLDNLIYSIKTECNQ